MWKMIYVAGPFRGKTPWEVEQNIRRAEGVSLEIARIGAIPLCPHTMYRFFDKQCDNNYWLRATEELLIKCDAIYLLKGWEKSEGAKGEHHLAVDTGMNIFFEEHPKGWSGLVKWVNSCGPYVFTGQVGK